MALKQFCANSQCPKHTIPAGGRFIYSAEKKDFFCEDCFHVPTVFNDGKNLWEFDTTHFNGEKIHVRNLAHLRELEKQYGCSNHAANYEEGNWNVPPPIKQREIPRELRDFMR